MALTSPKGADRVLYGLAALLQNKLPDKISQLSSQAETLLVTPVGLSFEDDQELKYEVDGVSYSINFPAGTYNQAGIKALINSTPGPLNAVDFSQYGLLLTSDKSIKFISGFCNIRPGQIVNYQPLVYPKTWIISGTLPGEDQIKAFPSVVLELASINPEPDSILVQYSVDLTLAITSPINSSQADYMSNQLFKYYDLVRDILQEDDGSLGGLINGVSIDSASIGEANGTTNFLKLLTISLTCSVEED